MNAKQFLQLYNNVKVSLFWKDYKELNNDLIKEISKKEKISFLQDSELDKAISELLLFDINLIWCKEFWGLKVHESICAVASEKSSFINRLRNKTN